MATFISVQVFLTTNYNDREDCCTHKDPVPYVLSLLWPYICIRKQKEHKRRIELTQRESEH